MGALVVLDLRGAQRPSDLMEPLGVSAATAGRVAKKLEHLGLVERHYDGDDGRSVILAITPAGQAVVDKVVERRREAACHVHEQVDPDVLPVIASVMAGLAKAAGYYDWP